MELDHNLKPLNHPDLSVVLPPPSLEALQAYCQARKQELFHMFLQAANAEDMREVKGRIYSLDELLLLCKSNR